MDFTSTPLTPILNDTKHDSNAIERYFTSISLKNGFFILLKIHINNDEQRRERRNQSTISTLVQNKFLPVRYSLNGEKP